MNYNGVGYDLTKRTSTRQRTRFGLYHCNDIAKANFIIGWEMVQEALSPFWTRLKQW